MMKRGEDNDTEKKQEQEEGTEGIIPWSLVVWRGGDEVER